MPLNIARYIAATPTLVDGQPLELRLDNHGRLIVDATVTATIGELQTNSATSSTSGTVNVDTTVGGTQVIGANVNRNYALFRNDGNVTVFWGAGTVDSTFSRLLPSERMIWESQEPLNVLASSGNANIEFIDYTN